MSGRQAAWAAGTGVVLAAGNSAVINELQGGWPWWVAAGVLTLAGAALAAAVAGGQRRVGRGAVVAGRDIAGRIRTDASVAGGSADSLSEPGVDPGAVVAGRDITEAADIDTTGGRSRRRPGLGR